MSESFVISRSVFVTSFPLLSVVGVRYHTSISCKNVVNSHIHPFVNMKNTSPLVSLLLLVLICLSESQVLPRPSNGLNEADLASHAKASFTSSSPLKTESFQWIEGHSQKNERTPRSVLDAYKIMNNTIIRTKESRSLGARYLNETSQVSRELCLKWCSDYQNIKQGETSVSCNVAVFEEMGRNSCYLFDCGLPGPGFKCQFTSHASYSSSVLNRASVDLNEWRDQSDHEKELLRLKSETDETQSPALVVKSADSVEKKSSRDPHHETTHSEFIPP